MNISDSDYVDLRENEPKANQEYACDISAYFVNILLNFSAASFTQFKGLVNPNDENDP